MHLVVDDEAAILAIMRATLENYGYNVVTAASGPEAIARLGSSSPAVDLVIADLDMPFMDGSTTILALPAPRLKAIIVSGSQDALEDAAKKIQCRRQFSNVHHRSLDQNCPDDASAVRKCLSIAAG